MTTKPDPDIKLVIVLRTSDPGIVAVAKSLLDDAAIDYFLQGEAIRNVMGWSSAGVFGGDAEFQVREGDAPTATRLLAQLTHPQIAAVPDDTAE